MDNRAIVASWIACWAAEDVEMTLAHLHENVVYKVHTSVSAAVRWREARA